MPADIIIQARKFAREVASLSPDERLVFASICALTQDEVLPAILKNKGLQSDPDDLSKSARLFLDEVHRFDVLDTLPEERTLAGYTIRRAVTKRGRNDPCHCGSRKKYKKCCYAADLQRLVDSSEVEGVTLGELEQEPERHLTHERIRRMRSFELCRLDPKKMSLELLLTVIQRLEGFSEFARICEILEAVPEFCQQFGIWVESLVLRMFRNRRAEIVRRLTAIYPSMVEDCGISTVLATCDEPAELLKEIEVCARRCVAAEEPLSDEVNTAHVMLRSNYPCLGVLLARAALATTGVISGLGLVQAVEEVRDELALSPSDPAEDIYEWRLKGHGEELRSEELIEAIRQLEAKRNEVNQLKLDVVNLKRDLDRKENIAAAASKALSGHISNESSPPAAVEIRELRAKLAATREELKLKHAERNELRRDLESARQELDRLQDRSEELDADGNRDLAADEEERCLGEMPTAQARNWPTRIPIFPDRFLDGVARFPAEVIRSAVASAGRLAAGDPAVILAVRPLKTLPHVYRLRISRDYRLCVAVDDSELRVLDLIARRDLEKWIKAHR